MARQATNDRTPIRIDRTLLARLRAEATRRVLGPELLAEIILAEALDRLEQLDPFSAVRQAIARTQPQDLPDTGVLTFSPAGALVAEPPTGSFRIDDGGLVIGDAPPLELRPEDVRAVAYCDACVRPIPHVHHLVINAVDPDDIGETGELLDWLPFGNDEPVPVWPLTDKAALHGFWLSITCSRSVIRQARFHPDGGVWPL